MSPNRWTWAYPLDCTRLMNRKGRALPHYHVLPAAHIKPCASEKQRRRTHDVDAPYFIYERRESADVHLQFFAAVFLA